MTVNDDVVQKLHPSIDFELEYIEVESGSPGVSPFKRPADVPGSEKAPPGVSAVEPSGGNSLSSLKLVKKKRRRRL